jgi:leucyl/phenylalanyl-tRNA---protein transferase
VPIPPPPTTWDFALEQVAPGDDLIGIGADLDVSTLYAAYSVGVFPMGIGHHGRPPIGWWSPDPRGVLRLGDLRVPRSLRKSMAHFEVRVDTAFDEVVAACADPGREGRWITPEVAQAYGALHDAGWAHSVETWQDGRLVGGLYGVAIGGLFAGESMFHTARDASKAALVALRDLLAADGDPRRLIDVQWRTDHLATLGVSEVSRQDYLEALPEVLSAPLPQRWA